MAAALRRQHCGGIKLTLKELSKKERDNSKSTRQQQKNETTAKVHQQHGDVPKTGASLRSKMFNFSKRLRLLKRFDTIKKISQGCCPL